jgi:hypothetical protein
MSIKIKTHTSYTYEDGAHSFPIPFEFYEYSAILSITADGQTAVLGCLAQDDSPEDPFEAWDEGTFVQFNSRYMHNTDRPEIEAWKNLVRANSGRIVTHSGTGDNHGPGTTDCYAKSVVTAAMCRGDKHTGENSMAEQLLDRSHGYYIVPSDVPLDKVLDYANSSFETYSSWCNGDVYGVCVWTFTRDGEGWELEDRDECWGYYGYKYASAELADTHAYTFSQLNKLAA